MGTGNVIVTIAGKKYLPTVVTMVHTCAHFDTVLGRTTLAQLQNQFKQSKGFTIRYKGTDKRLTLPWYLLISLTMELLVFGSPVGGTRNYHRHFRNRGAQYCKRIHKYLANKTLGDIFASVALTLAYQEKLLQLKDNKIVRLKSTHHTVDFNKTQHGEQFFRVFDNVCRRNMVAAAYGFNDSTTPIPIVSLQVIDDFVNCAKWVFPSLWRQLCELRGVVGH